jgi:hypothetical protein
MIDNGERLRLVIDGVFDGMAGVQGNQLAFMPNRGKKRPHEAKGAILDGKPIFLRTMTKDTVGPFWTARFEEIG